MPKYAVMVPFFIGGGKGVLVVAGEALTLCFDCEGDNDISSSCLLDVRGELTMHCRLGAGSVDSVVNARLL